MKAVMKNAPGYDNMNLETIYAQTEKELARRLTEALLNTSCHVKKVSMFCLRN